MSVEIDVNIKLDELFDSLEHNLDITLEAAGAYLLGGAVQKAPVDTGLLRNSLTYAIAGKPPDKKTYKADKPDETGKIREGHYVGSTTKAAGEHAVLIGSNVEYAIYQELGTSKGKHTPYLRPAVQDALDSGKLKTLIEKGLKGELG